MFNTVAHKNFFFFKKPTIKNLIHQLMCLCYLNWESYDSNWCLRNIDQFIHYCVTVLELIKNICY